MHARWTILCLVLLAGCGVSSPPADPMPIKLSAGVALPQLGPSGTLMMFSVDYRFKGDAAPDPAASYAWIIEPKNGEPLEQAVKLKRRSTLQAVAPQWRPENGPFKTHIVENSADGARHALSESVDLL